MLCYVMSCHTLYFAAVVRLLDAYKAQENVKDRELLLSALKCGKNQRYLTFALFFLPYDSDLGCFGRNWSRYQGVLGCISESFFVPKSIDELITYEQNQSLEYEFAVIIRTLLQIVNHRITNSRLIPERILSDNGMSMLCVHEVLVCCVRFH